MRVLTTCTYCNSKLKRSSLGKHKFRCAKQKDKSVKTIRYTKETYHEIYLKSSHWIAIKKRLYAQYKACRICESTTRLNIHHITYKRIGNELDSDLIVVCEDCHINKIHKKLINKGQLFNITGGREKLIRKTTRYEKRNLARKTNKADINKQTQSRLKKKMGTIAYYKMLRETI